MLTSAALPQIPQEPALPCVQASIAASSFTPDVRGKGDDHLRDRSSVVETSSGKKMNSLHPHCGFNAENQELHGGSGVIHEALMFSSLDRTAAD